MSTRRPDWRRVLSGFESNTEPLSGGIRKIMSDQSVNIVIIGGGVVGLAIAAELSRYQDDLFLLEAQPRLGLGTSTRNSGVIHAGIYYKPGSQKAFHCVEGARLLYDFCGAHAVPHQRVGKLIVAQTDDEIAELERLLGQAEANGAVGLHLVDQQRIAEIEPHIRGRAAIYSPNTGLVEPEELVRTLARLAESNGASLLTDTPVIGASVDGQRLLIRTPREEVEARVVINAAGLHADEIAGLFGNEDYRIHPCRGEYAEVIPQRSGLINGLVYPVPSADGHGLGVHFTKTLGGSLLLGPNARYVERKDDYENGLASLESFHEAAIRLLPDLRLEDLRHGYTGIRAKRHPANGPAFADFAIESDPQNSNLIHLVGIESPGLTSCLSMARQVAAMIQ